MKHLKTILFLLLPALLFGAAGDIKIDVKNSSNNAWISTIFAKQNGALFGTSGSGVPQLYTTIPSTITWNGGVIAGAYGGTGVANTGKTLTFSNNLTLAGTDGTTMTFPSTSSTIARTSGTNTFTGVQTFSSAPVATTGVYSATVTGTGGSSYGAILPVMVYVKSVTVLTTGSPADIATIVLPSGITRYVLAFSGTTAGGSRMIAETAAGTLAAASVTIRDASAGGGNIVISSTALPAGAGSITSGTGNVSAITYTSGTLYVRQTADSANAGTISIYVMVYPMP